MHAGMSSTALWLMLPSALLAFFVSQAILRQHHVQTTFGSPHVARAVIGSALFLDGQLVPNTELGHLEFHGQDAELTASARVVKANSPPRLPRPCAKSSVATLKNTSPECDALLNLRT